MLEYSNGVVSIVVPVYNVESFLDRCLQSLVNQTYQKIKIIMVDDCATDGSAKICAEYAKRYPKICEYVKRDVNGGLAAARNTGIDKAVGDWLFFVDSDDWLDLKCVEKVVSSAIKNNSEIVMCGYCYAWDNGKTKEINSFGKVNDSSSQKEKIALIPQPSATRRLYNKAFFDKCNLKFPEEVKRFEDMGVTIPLLTKTSKISIVNEPLYFYYQRSGSISNTNIKGMNLSFYDIVLKLTEHNSNKGFESELEFRAILEILYGKNVLLIKAKYKKSDFIDTMNTFEFKYSNWKENTYYKKMKGLKKMFISCASYRLWCVMKFLVFVKEFIDKRKGE